MSAEKRNYRALTKLTEAFLSEAWERFPEERHEVDPEGRTASEETLPREQRKGRRPEGAGCFQERKGRREHTEQEETAPAQAGLQGCSCTREEWLPLNHAGLPDERGCQKWRCPSQHWKRRFARTPKSHTKLNLLQALDLPIDTRVSFLLAAAPPSIYLALPGDLCDLKSQQNQPESSAQASPR